MVFCTAKEYGTNRSLWPEFGSAFDRTTKPGARELVEEWVACYSSTRDNVFWESLPAGAYASGPVLFRVQWRYQETKSRCNVSEVDSATLWCANARRRHGRRPHYVARGRTVHGQLFVCGPPARRQIEKKELVGNIWAQIVGGVRFRGRAATVHVVLHHVRQLYKWLNKFRLHIFRYSFE